MERDAGAIIAGIRDFEPEGENWSALDGLLVELFRASAGAQGIGAMLAVLERYPDDDGAGVFWAIVHGLESLPDYEPALVESVRRAPAELSLVMVGRLLNAGVSEAGGISLISLAREVAERPDAAPEARRIAEGIIARHRG